MGKASPLQKNDISIGEDRWITFGDLKNGQERAVDIDPYLEPVMSFLDLLETECVAGCCGIHAYGLWPDNINGALKTLGNQERHRLMSDLVKISTEVENLATDTVVSNRLNQYFRKDVFLEILEHIRSVAEEGDSDGCRSRKV